MTVPVIDIQPGDAPLIVNVLMTVVNTGGIGATTEALALPIPTGAIRDLYAFASDSGRRLRRRVFHAMSST